MSSISDNENRGGTQETDNLHKIEKRKPKMDMTVSKIPQVTANEIVKPVTVVGPKPWTSLFQQNRVATHGMTLRYIPPKS